SVRRAARSLLILLILACTGGFASSPAVAQNYAARADVRAFIDEMASVHGYNRVALKRAFAAARYQPRIVEAMQRPLLEPPKWYDYVPQFLSQARVDGGVAYGNEIGRAHV